MVLANRLFLFFVPMERLAPHNCFAISGVARSHARETQSILCAEGETRTLMGLLPHDFESCASTSFTTPADNIKN